VVPVGRVVVEELAAHLAAFLSDGPLFVNEIGEPLIYRRWRTIWEAAAHQVGVDFTSRGLRHLFASALISGGASVKQVQTVLGHPSAMVTPKTCAIYGRATRTGR
jgi:site-specific recombinase XerD